MICYAVCPERTPSVWRPQTGRAGTKPHAFLKQMADVQKAWGSAGQPTVNHIAFRVAEFDTLSQVFTAAGIRIAVNMPVRGDTITITLEKRPELAVPAAQAESHESIREIAQLEADRRVAPGRSLHVSRNQFPASPFRRSGSTPVECSDERLIVPLGPEGAGRCPNQR